MPVAAKRVPARSNRTQPITLQRIVQISLGIIETEGFDALTMRRVAAALDTGPASLYVHVANKAALDDVLLGELSSRIDLPKPDPSQWREQALDVCGQLRDQYLQYPGIARAALATVPTNLQTLRIAEGLLGILLAGGFTPQVAAWGIDAITLHVTAYALERSLVRATPTGDDSEWITSRPDLLHFLTSLPEDGFPHTRDHAEALISGERHDRFDFALQVLLDGLPRTPRT